MPSSQLVEPVTFTTEDDVRLEGELRRPDTEPVATAVVCHPHPLHGGSKDHPILWAIRNELAGVRGMAVLGFNFRGVMGSDGTYGGGRDELLDVRAAIDRVRREASYRPTVMCGWSFGANVAVREALEDDRVAALTMVGVPLAPNDLTLPPLPQAAELSAFRRPALVLCGDRDEYCPVDEARAWAAAFPDGRLIVLEGTGHYLGRREREAATRIGEFMDEALRR
jgi:alpha/beta superfamily hydrolase